MVITGDITNDRKPPFQIKIIDFKPAGGAGSTVKPAAAAPSKPAVQK
jgi:hypothetical protein